MKKKSIFTGIIIVIIIVAATALYAAKSGKLSGLGSPDHLTGRVQGSADAPVQIIEFSDFQCPACQQAQAALEELKSKYGDKIAITFKHFPLDGHLWAQVAHQAAECSGEQGKFWEYHDRLYNEQPEWSGPTHPLETFVRYARDLNLDLKSFGACITDEAIQKRIFAQRDEGMKLKVNSTPTFFIGEERLVGPIQIKVQGEKVVREALGLPPLTE